MGESLDGRRTMTMPALVCLFMGDFARARRIAAGAVARLRDDARPADLAGMLTLLAGVQVGARLVSEAATSGRRDPLRVIQLTEVAAAIAYLASPAASATTATALAVDEGMQGLRLRSHDAALGRDRRKPACDGWRAAYTDARRA
jgi:hypothetical protein